MAKIDLFPFTIIVTWNNVVVTVILLTYNNKFKYVGGNASIHSTEQEDMVTGHNVFVVKRKCTPLHRYKIVTFLVSRL